MDARVIYEDDHLVVAYKPYGALSEEDAHQPNMPDMLCEMLGCPRIYPVHRLDRTTQGLMLFAKTSEAAKRLSAMFQCGEVEKRYLAAVQGTPEPPEGEMHDLLYFDRKKNKSFVVKRERRGVKDARLQYETLSSAEVGGEWLSLVRVRLLTGRTHQIRVQFASRKMPLVGDRRYGSRMQSDEILLCSAELSFVHPFTGEEMQFSYAPDNGLFQEFNR